MRKIIESIEEEYRRYRKLGEGAFAQLHDAELSAAASGGGNSAAVLVWHVAGNLASRFTDFLTSDGEKPWRQRDEEFKARQVSRKELLEKWESGWSVLVAALAALSDEDLGRTVTIRGKPLKVHEALHRSLAHAAYHVGQIVYIAKEMRGVSWKSLSIPLGGSAAYNLSPDRERPPR